MKPITNEAIEKVRNAKNLALVLSGGGSRGSYEIGVWQALLELDIHPKIVVGTSVGALNGAMMAMDKFEEAKEFWLHAHTDEIFQMPSIELPENALLTIKNELVKKKSNGFAGDGLSNVNINDIFGKAKDFLTSGVLESHGLMKILHRFIDEETVRNSPIQYGLVATEIEGMKGHRLFIEDIPRGLFHDYILASASCFPAAQSHDIEGVRFIDGGYIDNLPIGMALDKDADMIISVNLKAVGKVITEDIKRANNLIMIAPNHDLGNFLLFDGDVAKNNLRLGWLDTMKALGVYDGRYYTFEKNTFTYKEHLIQAQSIARIFEPDFLCIYTKDTFRAAISKEVTFAKKIIDDLNPKNKDSKPNLHPPEVLSVVKKFKTLGDNILTVFIAQDIKEKGGKSIFLQFPAEKAIKAHIFAAKYLLRESLV